MKAHQNSTGKNQTWITPPEIIKALGEFDLDPCCADTMPYNTAKFGYRKEHDGLKQNWMGRVWLNPPFDRRERHLWMKKMSEHKNGVMLIPAACETDAFYKYVWSCFTGILFIKGRPHFHYEDGTRAKANSGCTICLVSYDQYNLEALQKSNLGIVLTSM